MASTYSRESTLMGTARNSIRYPATPSNRGYICGTIAFLVYLFSHFCVKTVEPFLFDQEILNIKVMFILSPTFVVILSRPRLVPKQCSGNHLHFRDHFQFSDAAMKASTVGHSGGKATDLELLSAFHKGLTFL